MPAILWLQAVKVYNHFMGGMVAQEAMSAREILALVSWSEPASLLVPCKPGVNKNCSVAPQSIAAGKVVQLISLGRAEPIERWALSGPQIHTQTGSLDSRGT